MRKQFSPTFKAQVVQELLKEEKSVAQVGENFRQAEAGIAPTRPAAYVFIPSSGEVWGVVTRIPIMVTRGRREGAVLCYTRPGDEARPRLYPRPTRHRSVADSFYGHHAA